MGSQTGHFHKHVSATLQGANLHRCVIGNKCDMQQAFILQSLADDSAYPRGPRGNVEAMNVVPIHRKSNKDLAAELASQLRCQEEAQVMGSAGDPISRPAKQKQFWLRQDGPPLCPFLSC